MTTRNGRFCTLAPCVVLVLATALMSGCGDDANTESSPTGDTLSGGSDSAPQGTAANNGFSLVSADDAAALLEDPPTDLVILDVRTPDEYEEGHIEGSIMLDFYEADFADRLAELDTDVPYLVYCRSGNRSGQTSQLMAKLGFASVYDVDGGVIAWADSGLPLSK
ncbi:MAG: rhodanese-like domain-containing protein [Actinomycetia bacterium]|nr:rhodanese-like domain-containing protein [Actinomycetes bacterium]MCP4085283.1 rhodanese-like domain-containing protein [Actinomycetes bacterium]